MAADALPSDDPLAGIPLVSPATHGRHSRLERVALTAHRRHGTHAGLAGRLGLTAAEALCLFYTPTHTLRPVQQMPSAIDPALALWRHYLELGGRGAGKTHSGSASVIEEAQLDAEARILIVGPTYTEIQKNQLEGPSGILTLAPPWFKPQHFRSKKQLVFPNGVVADYLPAADADKFRGYGYTFEWLDEIVAWKKDPVAVWKECGRVGRGTTARMRRLGLSSRKVITTTPAPTPLFREILSEREGLVLGRSSTFDNATNLDPAYIRQARRLAMTTEGRREFLGELRFDLDPALYRKVDWSRWRVARAPEHFDLVVVSVDPATGEKKGADEHGIVVLGIRQEDDGLDHVYVLADLSVRDPSPSVWAKKAVDALEAWAPQAKRAWIFAETNTGGSMVKGTIHQVKRVKVKTERARNSKAERAAPVSMLCEAGLVHMVGKHHKLEDQLSRFTGIDGGHARDDRADAFAWPIWKYVCRRRRNHGALGALAAQVQADDGGEEEDEEQAA